MTSRSRIGWRAFFLLAAGWNLAIGLPIVAAPESMMATLAGVESPTPLSVLLFRDLGASVIVFGFGYAAAAMNPDRHRVPLWMGAAGKLYLVIVSVPRVVTGAVSPALLLPVAGDFLFALAFLWFLIVASKR